MLFRSTYTVKVKGLDDYGNFVFYPTKEFTTDKEPLQYFGIQIGDKFLTTLNYESINSQNFPAIRKGTVHYNRKTNTLTLKDAEIDGSIYYERGYDDPKKELTINLEGYSSLGKKSIYFYGAPLYINGGGTLELYHITASYQEANDTNLFIVGCHIKINHIISLKGKVTINRATVETKAGIDSAGNIELLNCKIKKPVGGEIKSFYNEKLERTFWTIFAPGDKSPYNWDVTIEP